MKIFLLFASFSLLLAQDTTIVFFGESSLIIIDTQVPSADLLIPDNGELYETDEMISVEWLASDSLFGETPISIFIESKIGNNFVPLELEIANESQTMLQLPNIHSLYSRMKIVVTDYFGNINFDVSDGYFSIIDPNIGVGQDSTIIVFDETSILVLDTKNPVLELYSPNGDEVFQSGGLIECDWYAHDDYFGDTPISILLAENINSEFEPLIENLYNSSPVEVQLPLIFSNLARCKLIASDYYGNIAIDYSDGYFAILDTNITEINDTTSVVFGESNIITVDSKNPLIELISPNGGEQFDSEETIAVEWSASDDSFSGNDIDISVATEIGGWFIPMVEQISNISPYNVQLPNLDMAFVRLKVTATDSFGNNTSDYGDDYFILGDPFDDFVASAIEDFVVLNWGWGSYHLVLIRPDALSFLQNGDEIHIVDDLGIIEEGCSEDPNQGIGPVSVANTEYSSLSDSLFTFSCIGSVDLCELDGPRLPGFILGNTIHFFIFDASADSVFEIIPNGFESGQGIFGEPMTVVNSFNINNQRHPNSNEFIINEIRTEPEFTYHIFRDGESILTDYNFDYYIDPTVVSGNNYCYIIELIDSDGSVIITSDESCILYDPDNITPGDITHDQLVNILDVVMIVDYIINNILPTNFELLAADLNQDFILDVVDLVLLVDLILSQ